MFSIARAAAFAVAAIGAALSPSFADPSLAWEVDPAAPTATYIDHAEASIDDGALDTGALEPVKALSHDIHFSTPVAQHAVATDAAVPAFAPEADKASKKPLSMLVDAYAGTDTDNSEMECLAGAIYFESKGEPLAGQLAVAEVIINRSRSGRYPTTLCGVVKQPSQFSFVRGGRIPSINKDSASWRKAVAIAHIAMKDLADSPVPTALSFHATRVSPGWNMKRMATVGNHVFYR